MDCSIFALLKQKWIPLYHFRIDANVEDTQLNVDLAHTEILKYFQSVSNNRWLLIKMFLILVIFFIVFVLFMTWRPALRDADFEEYKIHSIWRVKEAVLLLLSAFYLLTGWCLLLILVSKIGESLNSSTDKAAGSFSWISNNLTIIICFVVCRRNQHLFSESHTLANNSNYFNRFWFIQSKCKL